jgi:hypothetical protein
MTDGVKERVSVAEIEVLQSGLRFLHLRIPVPNRKAVWIIMATVGLGLVLQSGLVDLETTQQLLEILSGALAAGTP